MVRWEHNATLVYGPITKSVEDGAFFLDQVVGPDPRDPRSLPHPGFSYLEAVQKPPRKLKIAYSPDLGYAVVQPDVAAVVEGAVKFFEKSGHSVTEISGGPPDMGVEWGLLSAYEIGGHIEGFRPERDADITRALLYTIPPDKMGIDQKTWGRMCNNRVALVDWCANLFGEYDLLVTPTVPYDPPPAKGPLPKETNGRKHTMTATAYFTIPFSLSWNPAATVRAGFSDEGFPVGMQLVGPQHRDDLVLRAARAFEREHYFAKSWPVFD
jgi:aspartyl-tRNA(Asn)/glutamyl-tRNA(Gln) amidotransferase subunit A